MRNGEKREGGGEEVEEKCREAEEKEKERGERKSAPEIITLTLTTGKVALH